jgi:hypothetical protein
MDHLFEDEGQDRIKASYKHKYDPNNLFRVNQNILPGT